MSEYMVIPGTHPLLRFINRADGGVLAHAAVEALDDQPDGYDVDRFDIVMRRSVLQNLLSAFWFVRAEDYGLNSIFRWYCTKAKLSAVLDFVGETLDAADQDEFISMTTYPDGSVIPMPLGDLAYVLHVLAAMHDETFPDELLADNPQLQLVNADYLLVPEPTQAELAENPQAGRWDTSHGGGPELDAHYGQQQWRQTFTGAFTLELLAEVAPNPTDAHRLYQYLASTITSPGVGSCPVVVLRGLHSLLKSTVFGDDLMAWSDMLVSLDGRTAALDIAGALLQALGALTIGLCPLPVLTTKAPSAYGYKQLISLIAKRLVETDGDMTALFADVRMSSVSLLLALDEMAMAVSLPSPTSLAELRRVASRAARLQENLILQDNTAPAFLRSAIAQFADQSDARNSSAASASSATPHGANHSSQDSAGFLPSIISASDIEDLVVASLDSDGGLISNPHDVFTFMRESEMAEAGIYNAFRVLLACPQLFAGNHTPAARLFQGLTPFTVTNTVKTLALFEPKAGSGSPKPPWTFNETSTPRLDIPLKMVKLIMTGAFEKLDVLALASSLVVAQYNMWSSSPVVKLEPKLAMPLFSVREHASIYCSTLAAALAAAGIQQGAYGTDWLYDVLTKYQSGMRMFQPPPHELALIATRLVGSISTEIANFNALAKKAKLLAAPVVGSTPSEAASLVPVMEERVQRMQQRVQDGELQITNKHAPPDNSLIAGLSIVSLATPAGGGASASASASATAVAPSSAKKDKKRKAVVTFEDEGGHGSPRNISTDVPARRADSRLPQRQRSGDGRYDDATPGDIAQNKFFSENVEFSVVNGHNSVGIKGVAGTFKRADLNNFRSKHSLPSFQYALVRHLPNWKKFIKPSILEKGLPFKELTADMKKELEALRETSVGATVYGNLN